jgi:hypothetical protein
MDRCMTSQKGLCILGLLGGFVAGLALALQYLARSMDNAPLWDLVLRGGPDYSLLTYPVGGTLAGALGVWGTTRWRRTVPTIVVILLSSLLGAMVAAGGSYVLPCRIWRTSHEWNDWHCAFSDAFWLTVDMPVMAALFAIVTTLLALLARRIAGGAKAPQA